MKSEERVEIRAMAFAEAYFAKAGWTGQSRKRRYHYANLDPKLREAVTE